MNKSIFVFWTGDNEMSQTRADCLRQLREVSACHVILVTKHNLHDYLLPNEPLHYAYQFLSETHKADYLRTYFMNFIGGGYSDIKRTTGHWLKSFDDLYNNDDKWIIGYQEIEHGSAYIPPNAPTLFYKELIGNCCYICKKNTPLTNEWYNEMISVLDKKLLKLMKYPSTFPQDRAEISNGKYPMEWNEMLGRIFQKHCYTYRNRLLYTLPPNNFTNYR